jgi:hypothetical protein
MAGQSGQSATAEATAFVAGMRPLFDAIRSTIDAGDGIWFGAENTQGQAAAIAMESRRLSHLCSAFSITPQTGIDVALTSEFASILGARLDMLSSAAELLRTTEVNFSDVDAERQRTTSDIHSISPSLDAFAADSNVAESAGAEDYTISNPLLELSVNVAGGGVTVRNGIDVFVTADPDLQRYSVSGHGPDAWRLGTALRIRRFRNDIDRTLEEATLALESLLVRFGNRSSEQVGSIIGGEQAARLTYVIDDGFWFTLVGVTVVSDATYLFELGCPVEFTGECEDAFKDVFAGVTFNSD